MMRHVPVLWAMVLVLLAPMAWGQQPTVSGRVKLFTSMFLNANRTGPVFFHDRGEFATKRLELRLKIGGTLGERVEYFVRFDAFSSPDARITPRAFPESTLLGAPVRAEPFDLSLYEGYIRMTGLLGGRLDVTLGKQRIAWGTADKLNVVDNLNPLDFANFFTFDPDWFGERRPQTALNLEYYLAGDTRIQIVWLLSRQIAPLPAGFPLWMEREARSAGWYLETESRLLKHTNLGVRFSTTVWNIDLGLTYYHGNESLLVFLGLVAEGQRRIRRFGYPGMDVVGLDLATEWGGVGLWAEVAGYFPADVRASVVVPDPLWPGTVQTRTFPLFEDRYIKYVVGLDYTFDIGEGLYVNLQWVHGFADERDYSQMAQQWFGFRAGQFFGEIADYLVVRAEQSLSRGDLKLKLAVFREFAGDATAMVWLPAVEGRILDRVVVEVGALVVGGDVRTKFGSFRHDRIGYLMVRTDF